MSNDYQRTLEAAAAVHRFTPPMIVYAVGVTGNINFEELKAIASNQNFVSTISSFDSLKDIQEQQTYDLCNRGMMLKTYSVLEYCISFPSIEEKEQLLSVCICMTAYYSFFNVAHFRGLAV